MNIQYRIILPLLLFFVVNLTYSQVNYQVASIEIKGNKVIDEDMVSEQMNLRDMNLKEKFFFWKKTPGYSSLILDNDMERIQNFYRRNGFLEAEITKELQVNDKKKKVSILIQINEGKPVVLQKIQYSEHSDSSKTGIIETAKENIALHDDITLHEGQRFQDKNIYSVVEYLKLSYRNKGFPFVEVRNEVSVDPSAYEAGVTFHIYPGVKAKFGEVIFEGDSLISRSFISKKLTFNKGDEYSLEAMEKSQQEIFETGLFNYAIIRARKDNMRDGSLPVLVRVKEMPQWSFKGGVGYGTEDRFRVSAELMKRHFLGGARKLLLQGKRSYYLPFSIDAKFIQPDIFNQKVDFVFNPFYIREREESYEVDRLGTGVTLQKKFSPAFSSYVTYSLQQDNLLDKTMADSDSVIPADQLIHNKSGITLGLSNNTTDNIFEPTKGWRLKGYFTYMGLGFESEFHYYQIGLDTRHYKELWPDFVIAGRIHGGIIAPLQKDESTPIEDRYFAGGASSLRGWPRNSISPMNDKGKAVGGNTILETNIELRFPIYKILSGTVFVDAGNVWRESYQFDFTDLYYNTGVGLRVTTPIGPIRVDAAFPLFQGEFSTQFFVSLGHAF